MEEVDVVLLYEKALRELDVACIVKALAQRLHGLRVEIVQQNYGYPYALKNFRPRVVALPFCYQNRSNNILLTTWRKSIFFNLTWEQLLYPGNKTAKTPRGDFAVNRVIHHSWSSFYSGYLRQQGVPADHIFTNGNPAYALYREPYRHYFKQRDVLASQYELNPKRKWVFFPENYNWAFYDQAMLNQMIHDGQKPDEVYEMKAFSSRSFETVIRWCKMLADRGDVELIIRPRPSTLLDDFAAKIKEILHLIPDCMNINQQETVREWILASDVVISSYSTSLIEAAVAGKTAFMLEPYPLPISLQQDWHELLPHLTNEREFIDVLLVDSADVASKPLGEWARSAMLSQGDPILNLVDYLARLCQGKIQRPPIPSKNSVSLPGRFPLPPWLLFEYRKLRLRLQPPEHIPFDQVEPDRKHDVISASDINERVNKWDTFMSNSVVSGKNY